MKQSLRLPDIILTAAYTAIYFLIIGISALLTVFVLPGYSFIFIPILVALLSGSIYYLLALKVPKFGALTLMATFIGIFYLVSGRYPAAILFSIGFGLLADLIAKMGDYRNRANLFISYLVFAFTNVGPIIPIFAFQNSYLDHIEGTGQNLDQVQSVFNSISSNTALIVIALIILAASIGGFVGQKLIRKHFMKDETHA